MVVIGRCIVSLRLSQELGTPGGFGVRMEGGQGFDLQITGVGMITGVGTMHSL